MPRCIVYDTDTDPATVLIVDDSEENIDILLNLLPTARALVSLDGPTALEILDRTLPDIILLDVIMPGMDGFELCRIIREDNRFDDIPILFITARNDEESIVRGFEIGGNDYVTRPFRPAELLARVRSQVRYKRAMEQLKYIAVTDELTGIPNRRAFFGRGQDLFESAQRAGRPLSALMLDIDFFKRINDTYGHAEGDQVLRCFASLVGECINGSDLFGRLGGEEFAIVPLHRWGDQAVELAESVRRGIEAAEIPIGRHRLRFTVSIGVSHCGPGVASAVAFDELLSQADMFLYIAKKRGRNFVHHPGIGGVFETDDYQPRVRHRKR